MKKLILLGLMIALSASSVVSAQANQEVEDVTTVSTKKTFLSGSADATMFQLAMVDLLGNSEMSTLRFSYFMNGGTHLNHKLSSSLTVFTGLNIKNMGYITKNDSMTNKHRVYTIGLPIGLKIGNLKKGYAIVGGGVDFPFNYKWKSWDERKNKVKGNEWFSNKVNPVMPYVTLGYRFKNSLVVKGMYYPTNFWNSDNTINGVVNMMALTLGFDINTKKKGKSITFGAK